MRNHVICTNGRKREKNPNGQEPDRMHMFYVTYTLSDGLFPQPEAARRYAQLEHLTRPTNGEEGMNRDEAFTDVMGEDGHGRAKMYGVGVTPKMFRKEDCQHHEQMNEVVQRMADDEAHAKVRELEESHERTKQELIAAHEKTKQELIASNDATAQELAATKKNLAATEANLETTNQKVESMPLILMQLEHS